ncbi:MAG: hypothetical protein U0989_19085 [Azonexus sp.]|nr:hypothetical protein [Azonexus sp.]MDP3636883.1 hypothetical protein [Azonexus sp.]MDZ4316859.1 hypothetical protein [Azonexus sp.]
MAGIVEHFSPGHVYITIKTFALPADVADALRCGRKIDAIRLLRVSWKIAGGRKSNGTTICVIFMKENSGKVAG